MANNNCTLSFFAITPFKSLFSLILFPVIFSHFKKFFLTFYFTIIHRYIYAINSILFYINWYILVCTVQQDLVYNVLQSLVYNCTVRSGIHCTARSGINCSARFGIYCTIRSGIYCTARSGIYCTARFGIYCTARSGI